MGPKKIDVEPQLVDQVAGAWSALLPGWHLNDRGRGYAASLVKRFGVPAVLEAMRISVSTYVRKVDGKATEESVRDALAKVGGICFNKTRSKGDRPRQEIRMAPKHPAQKVTREAPATGDPSRQEIESGFWTFDAQYGERCSAYPARPELRRLWTEQIAPVLRARGASARANEVAHRLVELCLEEYRDGNHESHWSAMESVLRDVAPESLLGGQPDKQGS